MSGGLPWDQDPPPEPGGPAGGRRSYSRLFREKAWRAWTPDTGPSRAVAPRCGRVLALDGRFERGGEPGDLGDPPVCGRPAGHPPVPGKPWKSGCRSEAAVARYLRADRDRQAAARERSRAA